MLTAMKWTSWQAVAAEGGTLTCVCACVCVGVQLIGFKLIYRHVSEALGQICMSAAEDRQIEEGLIQLPLHIHALPHTHTHRLNIILTGAEKTLVIIFSEPFYFYVIDYLNWLRKCSI